MAEVLPFTFRTSGYKIVTNLPDASQPWRKKKAPLVDLGLHDSYGVRMFKWNGIIYNHPVAQIQYALNNLASFRATGDPFYLKRCRANAERNISRRTYARGAYYYPYPFNYTHTVHTGLVFKAPWYSGMAQGEALSLFSQLASLSPALSYTDRQRYRTIAGYTFVSLLRSNNYNPWVINKDGEYYWIQEYPTRPENGYPDYTYNGMMFAMLGIWDYYKLTSDPLAFQLWDGSLTTIDKYYPNLRNIGDASDYCRTHNIPTPTYHQHHIDLLDQLTVLSGNPRFHVYADELRSDYP